ncbi:TPA: amidohydrolase family protein [Streptococcus agalactiae]
MYIIKNGLIIDPQSGFNQVSDMLIDQGKIKQISKEIDIKGIPIIDASNKIVAPGLVDIHVHFREPGQTHKENIHTGALSAAAGGFTTVLMMANTNPTISSPEIVKQVKESAAKAGAIIGSAFPVVGTAGGAVVGFAIGVAGSMAFDWLYDNKEQVYNTTKKVISTRKTIDSVVYEGFWR